MTGLPEVRQAAPPNDAARTPGDPVTARLRCAFLPDWRNNPYQPMLAQALERRGVAVSFHEMPDRILGLARMVAGGSLRGTDVVHLHWVNKLVAGIVHSRPGWRRRARLALLLLDVWAARVLGKRVVWTVHNLVAHESANPQAELQARRVLARACSSLIVHSEGALRLLERTYGFGLSGKANVIPHGSYEGCYAPSEARAALWCQRLGLSGEETTYLFFGAVRGYKGLTTLIERFTAAKGAHLRLVIAGRPSPGLAQRQVEAAAAEDGRIRLALGFIEDADVAPLFSVCDAAVVPFERTLTSGSAVLALTMGKALLLPGHARMLDLVDDEWEGFFESGEELTARFEDLAKSTLRAMGLRAHGFAQRLDWAVIAERTHAAYFGTAPASERVR